MVGDVKRGMTDLLVFAHEAVKGDVVRINISRIDR